jgi:hypothetical protein
MKCEEFTDNHDSCVITRYPLSPNGHKNNRGQSYPYSPEMHINHGIYPKNGR